MDSGRLGGMFFKGEWAFCVFKTTHARCDKNHRHFIEQDIMMDETFCCTEFLVDIDMYTSGQIIATSHDLGPQMVVLVREMPLFQGNLGW